MAHLFNVVLVTEFNIYTVILCSSLQQHQNKIGMSPFYSTRQILLTHVANN